MDATASDGGAPDGGGPLPTYPVDVSAGRCELLWERWGPTADARSGDNLSVRGTEVYFVEREGDRGFLLRVDGLDGRVLAREPIGSADEQRTLVLADDLNADGVPDIVLAGGIQRVEVPSAEATCMPPDDCEAAALTCDGPEDCGGGSACCLITSGAPPMVNVGTACSMRDDEACRAEFCHTDEDCSDPSLSCCPSPFGFGNVCMPEACP